MKGRFNKVAEWQKKTFPNATATSKCHHLKEEVEELLVETQGNVDMDKLSKELADCFILLIGVASHSGFTYNDVMKAIDNKLKINMKRKWGVPDANGVVKHVKNEGNK